MLPFLLKFSTFQANIPSELLCPICHDLLKVQQSSSSLSITITVDHQDYHHHNNYQHIREPQITLVVQHHIPHKLQPSQHHVPHNSHIMKNKKPQDAVMMPCCAGSACDECGRNGILESEGNKVSSVKNFLIIISIVTD